MKTIILIEYYEKSQKHFCNKFAIFHSVSNEKKHIKLPCSDRKSFNNE